MGTSDTSKTIFVDWSTISNFDDFFDSVFSQTDAPAWHGRNLNAINDSWGTGGICAKGPPFDFIFRNSKRIASDLRDFSKTVIELAEASVTENGGSITQEN